MEMPVFTKGKNQLSPLDVESTRKIASVRIHVERVIGLVGQKYTTSKTSGAKAHASQVGLVFKISEV